MPDAPDWLSHFYTYIPPIVTTTFTIFVLVTINRVTLKKLSGSKGRLLRQQLMMIALTFIGVLTILISLPISDSLKGQIFSLLGIIISAAIALSSTTFVGNAMAGLMLTGVKVFRIGDFIRVGEFFGRVSERGLLHVEIQTEDRDLMTLPNLYLVTNPTKVIHAEGTVISVEVSLGYDINRTLIETHLLTAAEASELESPFVQVISLGDFSVLYRVSGLLQDVKKIITAKSELHKKILDTLQNNGIEIVSPNFMNTRSFEPKHQFIPSIQTPVRPSEPVQEIEIESLLFEKAEQAETLSHLKKKLERVNSGKEKLEQLKDKSKTEEEKAVIQDKIDRLLKVEEKLQSLKTEMESSQK